MQKPERTDEMPREELARAADEVLANLKAEFPPVAFISATAAERAERDAARRARDEAVLQADAEARRLAVLLERLSVLPPKFRRLVAGEVKQTFAVRSAISWANGPARLLLIGGPMGVGKSVAAACALRAIVEHSKADASWHRPNDFVSGQLHDYDAKSPKIGRDLVVIDDMGRETKADFDEALTSLLDDSDCRILITTNQVDLEAMEARYDPRLMERLWEIGSAIWLKGDSLRVRGPGFRKESAK